MTKPEEQARQKIDELLKAAGWQIQDYKDIDLFVGQFRARLPRGVVGDECWRVQFEGLRACVFCPYEKNLFCIGKSVLRTGTNDVGMDIPVLNCISKA